LERLKGKALDVDLYILGSTQEETNSAGAVTAIYGAAPDFCVAVDVTHGTTPDAKKEDTFLLGEGPAIGLGPNCTRWMSDRFRRLTKKLEIPSQLEVMAGATGTNAWPMQISREGVATAVLSLPLRYMHTPIEVCSRSDLEDTARLLTAFVEGLGEEAEALC
jgi:endoglucanase